MTAPVTRLEAINSMLMAIGAWQITQLNSGSVEAANASFVLDETNKEVQAKGWDFNRELNVAFSPNTESEIVLPSNILRVDSTHKNGNLDLVQRGLRMYNRTDNTPKITQTVYLDIVTMLDFEEVPEVAKRYIVLRASRKFQAVMVGSPELNSFLEKDEWNAFRELRQAESEGQDYNIFASPDTRQMINRRNNWR